MDKMTDRNVRPPIKSRPNWRPDILVRRLIEKIDSLLLCARTKPQADNPVGGFFIVKKSGLR